MNNFENKIKEWVLLDNEIRILLENTKQLRERRSDVNNNVMECVSNNNLSNATVGISGGKLKFSTVKHIAPITLKYIEQCLLKCIHDENQVGKLMEYIKNNRQIQYTPEIKRTYVN